MNTGAAQRGLGKLRASWGQIRTYADLQEQLHRDLMAQHPEWIEFVAAAEALAREFRMEQLRELLEKHLHASTP